MHDSCNILTSSLPRVNIFAISGTHRPIIPCLEVWVSQDRMKISEKFQRLYICFHVHMSH